MTHQSSRDATPARAGDTGAAAPQGGGQSGAGQDGGGQGAGGRDGGVQSGAGRIGEGLPGDQSRRGGGQNGGAQGEDWPGGGGPGGGRDGDEGRMTVYFDGSCPLCTIEIDHYRRQRGAGGLAFVDASGPASDLGPGLARAAALGRFHVRLADGRLVSGARAFVAIWDALPGWRRAAWLARRPGVIHLLEVGYRLFLPLRPLLARAAARLGARPAAGRPGRSGRT